MTDDRFIYHIYRTDDVDYDETQAVVVCAANSTSARKLAASVCGDEGRETWLSGRRKSGHRSKVRKLGPAVVPNGYPAAERVIVRDFAAG